MEASTTEEDEWRGEEHDPGCDQYPAPNVAVLDGGRERNQHECSKGEPEQISDESEKALSVFGDEPLRSVFLHRKEAFMVVAEQVTGLGYEQASLSIRVVDGVSQRSTSVASVPTDLSLVDGLALVRGPAEVEKIMVPTCRLGLVSDAKVVSIVGGDEN